MQRFVRSLQPGTVTLVVGPSGSGKSVLLQKMQQQLSSCRFRCKPHGDGGDDKQWEDLLCKTSAESSRGALIVDEFLTALDRCEAQDSATRFAKVLQAARDKHSSSEPMGPIVLATCRWESVVSGLAQSCNQIFCVADCCSWQHDDFVEAAEGAPGYEHDVACIGRVRNARNLLNRPHLELNVHNISKGAAKRIWNRSFRQHHYLDNDLWKGAVCFVATLAGGHNAHVGGSVDDEENIAFAASYPLVVGFIAFVHQALGVNREHRLVVLPSFQGLGVGSRLSDAVARHVVTQETGRYVSHTAHYLLRNYREQSKSGWRKRHHDGGEQATNPSRGPLSRQEYVGSTPRTRIYVPDICKWLVTKVSALPEDVLERWNGLALGGWLDINDLADDMRPETVGELRDALCKWFEKSRLAIH